MKNNSVNVYYSDSCLDLVNTKAIQSKKFPLFVSVLAFPSIQTTVRTEFEHRRTNVEKKKKKNTLRRSALYFTLYRTLQLLVLLFFPESKRSSLFRLNLCPFVCSCIYLDRLVLCHMLVASSQNENTS